MTDQQDKDSAAKERRVTEKRIIQSPDYTGPDRRKSERRVIDQGDELSK